MATRGKTSDQSEPKRYLVQCDHCSLEQTADGRPEVEEIASTHRDETGHALVAVEWPV